MFSILAIKLMQAAQEARHGISLFDVSQRQRLFGKLLQPSVQSVDVVSHAHAS